MLQTHWGSSEALGDGRAVLKGSNGTPIGRRGTEDGWTIQTVSTHHKRKSKGGVRFGEWTRESDTALAQRPAVQARSMRPAPDSEAPTSLESKTRR